MRVTVLQHVLEQGKVSNTGRFVPLLLQGSALEPYGAPGAQVAPAGAHVFPPGSALLFPADEAPTLDLAAVQHLVVLDASWSQARRMVQRVPSLRALPRLSLAVTAPAKSLRDAPPGGLSTLQAVARALALLGDADAAAALERVHAHLLARTLAARGYV